MVSPQFSSFIKRSKKYDSLWSELTDEKVSTEKFQKSQTSKPNFGGEFAEKEEFRTPKKVSQKISSKKFPIEEEEEKEKKADYEVGNKILSENNEDSQFSLKMKTIDTKSVEKEFQKLLSGFSNKNPFESTNNQFNDPSKHESDLKRPLLEGKRETEKDLSQKKKGESSEASSSIEDSDEERNRRFLQQKQKKALEEKTVIREPEGKKSQPLISNQAEESSEASSIDDSDKDRKRLFSQQQKKKPLAEKTANREPEVKKNQPLVYNQTNDKGQNINNSNKSSGTDYEKRLQKINTAQIEEKFKNALSEEIVNPFAKIQAKPPQESPLRKPAKAKELFEENENLRNSSELDFEKVLQKVNTSKIEQKFQMLLSKEIANPFARIQAKRDLIPLNNPAKINESFENSKEIEKKLKDEENENEVSRDLSFQPEIRFQINYNKTRKTCDALLNTLAQRPVTKDYDIFGEFHKKKGNTASKGHFLSSNKKEKVSPSAFLEKKKKSSSSSSRSESEENSPKKKKNVSKKLNFYDSDEEEKKVKETPIQKDLKVYETQVFKGSQKGKDLNRKEKESSSEESQLKPKEGKKLSRNKENQRQTKSRKNNEKSPEESQNGSENQESNSEAKKHQSSKLKKPVLEKQMMDSSVDSKKQSQGSSSKGKSSIPFEKITPPSKNETSDESEEEKKTQNSFFAHKGDRKSKEERHSDVDSDDETTLKMQTKSQAEIEYLREQLRKNDLGKIDFDIDFGDIGDNKDADDAPANLKEIQDYLKNDILKSDLQHLNELTAFFYEEEHKKVVDAISAVDVLLKLDSTGVFGYPKLFDVLNFNVKQYVVSYMADKKFEVLDPDSLSGLIVIIATALIEKCN